MYTLSQSTEFVWQNLGKERELMYNDPNKVPADNDIKSWRVLITKVFTPLLDHMEQVFLTSKQTIRCEETRDLLHKLVAFAEKKPSFLRQLGLPMT